MSSIPIYPYPLQRQIAEWMSDLDGDYLESKSADDGSLYEDSDVSSWVQKAMKKRRVSEEQESAKKAGFTADDPISILSDDDEDFTKEQITAVSGFFTSLTIFQFCNFLYSKREFVTTDEYNLLS
jgi:hypothetical protein